MKQTAVEFLEKEIIEIMSYLEEDGAYAMQGVKDKLFGEKNIIQQAKEMEKKQMRNAYLTQFEMQCIDPNCDGVNRKGICIPSNKPKLDSEGCLIFKNK